MVKKLLTKIEKHVSDDVKRRESLKLKFQNKSNQQQLIKNSLAVDYSRGNSKKIIFDQEYLDEETSNHVEEKKNKNRLSLFENYDENDDDNESGKYEIKIKKQFEGRRGHKLLDLQSRYNNDDRFKLDERFLDGNDDNYCDEYVNEASNEGCYEEESQNFSNWQDNKFQNEKKKQLKVLESVLQTPIPTKSEVEKKKKESFFEMVRYDASNVNHKRQPEVDESHEGHKKKPKLEKASREKKKKESREPESRPPTSTEKFYQVSDDLKAALQNRTSDGASFSLLKEFSRNIQDSSEEEVSADECETPPKEEHKKFMRDPGDENVEPEKQEPTKVHGISNERFFFDIDDARFQEALTFINQKNSEEAREVAESYDKSRSRIREALRLRLQKHRQRTNPFKKKIGGFRQTTAKFNGKGKNFERNPKRRK